MALPLLSASPLAPDASQCPHFVQQLVQTALAEEHEERDDEMTLEAPVMMEVRSPRGPPWQRPGS
jgi:hypothetical protein